MQLYSNYNVYTCRERQHNFPLLHLCFQDSSGVLVMLVLDVNTISEYNYYANVHTLQYTLHAICRTEEYVNTRIIIALNCKLHAIQISYSPDACEHDELYSELVTGVLQDITYYSVAFSPWAVIIMSCSTPSCVTIENVTMKLCHTTHSSSLPAVLDCPDGGGGSVLEVCVSKRVKVILNFTVYT